MPLHTPIMMISGKLARMTGRICFTEILLEHSGQRRMTGAAPSRCGGWGGRRSEAIAREALLTGTQVG